MLSDEWFEMDDPDSTEGATLASTIQVSGRNHSLRDLAYQHKVRPEKSTTEDIDTHTRVHLYEAVFEDRDRRIPIPAETYAAMSSRDIMMADDAGAEKYMSSMRLSTKFKIPGPWVEARQKDRVYDMPTVLGWNDEKP